MDNNKSATQKIKSIEIIEQPNKSSNKSLTKITIDEYFF